MDARAEGGDGGEEVEEERLERGEMWRNPPKAFGMMMFDGCCDGSLMQTFERWCYGGKYMPKLMPHGRQMVVCIHLEFHPHLRNELFRVGQFQ